MRSLLELHGPEPDVSVQRVPERRKEETKQWQEGKTIHIVSKSTTSIAPCAGRKESRFRGTKEETGETGISNIYGALIAKNELRMRNGGGTINNLIQEGNMGRPIIELKPCPFCGSQADVRTFDRKTFYVTCSGCRADSGGYDTLADAVVAWNKRTERKEAAG